MQFGRLLCNHNTQSRRHLILFLCRFVLRSKNRTGRSFGSVAHPLSTRAFQVAQKKFPMQMKRLHIPFFGHIIRFHSSCGSSSTQFGQQRAEGGVTDNKTDATLAFVFSVYTHTSKASKANYQRAQSGRRAFEYAQRLLMTPRRVLRHCCCLFGISASSNAKTSATKPACTGYHDMGHCVFYRYAMPRRPHL